MMIDLDELIGKVGFPKSTLVTIKKLLRGGNFLLEYRTGGGKTTLAILVSLILANEFHKRVFFYTRTHLQINEIYTRMNKLAGNKSLVIIPLLGKELICPYSLVYSDPYDMCYNLRKSENCLLYKNFKSMPYNLTLLKNNYNNLEDLISEIFLKGVCPYYYLIGAINHADIVISTYYHFFYPPHYLMLKPYQYVIIIDEFHNLPFYYPNLQIYKIECSEIKNAFSIVSNLIPSLPSQVLDALIACKPYLFDDQTQINSAYKTLRYFSYFLKNFLSWNIENTEKIKQLFPDLIALPNIHNVQGLEIKENKVFIYSRYNSKFIESFVKFSYLNLFMSATLSPPKIFQRFIRKIFKISNFFFINNIYNSQSFPFKINVYFIKGYTSLYTRRSKALYESISSALVKLAESVGDIVVFNVSKEFQNQLYNELSRMYSSHKIVVFNESIDDFFLRVPSTIRKIFMFTYRGIFAEGVNVLRFSGIKNIAIIGFPIPPPSSYISKYVYLSYGYRDEKRVFKYGYIHPALISVVQSIGRLFKFKSSSVNVYVFEDRLRQYLFSNLVPEWFKSAIVVKEMKLHV